MPETTEPASPPLRTWRPMAAGGSVVGHLAPAAGAGKMAGMNDQGKVPDPADGDHFDVPSAPDTTSLADREIEALFALHRFVLYVALGIALAVMGIWYLIGRVMVDHGHPIWVLPLTVGLVFAAVLTLYKFPQGRGFLRLIGISVAKIPMGGLQPRTHVIIWGILSFIALAIAILGTFPGIIRGLVRGS